jgi:hypothetical protein
MKPTTALHFWVIDNCGAPLSIHVLTFRYLGVFHHESKLHFAD